MVPELLVPAGGLNQLKTAVRYGADAVYFGLSEYGLRVRAENFSWNTLRDGVEFAHARHVKAFLTLNVFAYDNDIDNMAEAARKAHAYGIDAVIMSDPGAIVAVRNAAPSLSIHLSTQANTMNAHAARFWHEHGVARIVLSRELSLDQIKYIRRETPDTLELEVFAHGSVCMAYSGRCILSGYLLGRNANKGDCAQPCRWKYRLVEETRENLFFPLLEDEGGTDILSAGDLCMIDHLDDLTDAGIQSIKIEGRMKNEYYVASVTGAYRRGLNAVREGRYCEAVGSELRSEIEKAGHRNLDTGFYYGRPEFPGNGGTVAQTMEFAARVLSVMPDALLVEVRNRLIVGDMLELMRPEGYTQFVLDEIRLENGSCVDACGTPMAAVVIPFKGHAEQGDIIRGYARNHRVGNVTNVNLKETGCIY